MLSRVLTLCMALSLVGVLAADDAIDYGPLPPPQQPEFEAVLKLPQIIRDAEVVPVASLETEFSPSDKQAELECKLQQAAELHGEIDKLRSEIGANEQILVRVEMLEVSLTKLRKLGADFAMPGKGKVSFQSLDQLRQAFKVASTHSAGDASDKSASGPASFLEWLEQNQIAKSLAQPNMIVVNGRPATMFAGGEIPLPASDDSKAIQFQKYGTEVNVLAVARDREHVRLELRARVSELDDTHSIGAEGSRIPAMTVRECDTAVETSFGEPVIVDGIVETYFETIETEHGVADEQNEVALLIVVTPEHVDAKKSADGQPCPYTAPNHAATSAPMPAHAAVATPQPIFAAPYGEYCKPMCQSQAAQVQPQGGPLSQYKLQFQVFEISSDELAKIGVAWPEAGDGFTPERVTALRTAINEAVAASKDSSQPLAPLEKDDLNGVLDWLGHHNAVRILADPTIAVTSGHATSFSNLHGPTYPGPNGKGGVEPCQCGVTIDCTATEKNAHVVQLNLKFKQVEPIDRDPSSPPNPSVPAVSVSQCCTTLTLTNGKTFVLGGLVCACERARQ